MSEEGMSYYELLNKDGKKKTGTTSLDICNLLVWLKDYCSTGSILVMDNTTIHGGEDFEKVCNLLKESEKNLEIEFLAKYSPFLNPIKLAFNIIKINVKHKEVKLQSDLGSNYKQVFEIYLKTI